MAPQDHERAATLMDTVKRCRDNPAPLSTWEDAFLAGMEAYSRRGRLPTRPQRNTLSRIAQRIGIADIARQLAPDIERLACELTGTEPTSRRSGGVRFRSRGSLAVCTAGAKRGSWFDHEAGVGGDALGLIAHLGRMPPGEAIGWALGRLGTRPVGAARPVPELAVAPADGAKDAVQRRNREAARRLWSEAVAPIGSLVEGYLRSRGLFLRHDASLRFHPACPRGAERLPTMLALMTDAASGEPRGVHRTFLAPDGSGKAASGSNGEAVKMMLGNAGVVRLTPDEDVTLGLGLCEGIETGLALLQRFGWAPIWAASCAGAIRRFPALPGIETLTIFADADAPGLAAARACTARWTEAGREARVVWPGEAGRDFADRAAA